MERFLQLLSINSNPSWHLQTLVVTVHVALSMVLQSSVVPHGSPGTRGLHDVPSVLFMCPGRHSHKFWIEHLLPFMYFVQSVLLLHGVVPMVSA